MKKKQNYFFNSNAGKRKAPEWDNLFLDHLNDLRLLYFDGGANTDLVEKLLFAGAPVVIGIQSNESQETAEAFRKVFYQELLHGKTVLKAFEEARKLDPDLFIIRKIASDPYEYWENKEKEDPDAPFLWGLYYLSANEAALNWRIVNPEEVKFIGEEVEVAKEASTKELKETVIPEAEIITEESQLVENEKIEEKLESEDNKTDGVTEKIETKEEETPLAEKEEKAVEVIEAAKEEVEKVESLEAERRRNTFS